MILSSEQVSVSMIIFTFSTIKTIISNMTFVINTQDVMNNFKSLILKHFDFYSPCYFESNMVVIATVLDPRYKMTFFKNKQSVVEKWKRSLKEKKVL